ncbi:hypothetical protein BU17DRAFT_79261 [Hysterangium stoloniferum]|nr:hypothetical protein BU17DRAFT_79261 [Hysterangium stoloniferum]
MPCVGDDPISAVKIFLVAGIPSIVIFVVVGVFFWYTFRKRRSARVYTLFPPSNVSQAQLQLDGTPAAVSTAGAEMSYARAYPQSIASDKSMPADSSKSTSPQSQLACPMGGPAYERSKEAATHYGYSLGLV